MSIQLFIDGPFSDNHDYLPLNVILLNELSVYKLDIGEALKIILLMNFLMAVITIYFEKIFLCKVHHP